MESHEKASTEADAQATRLEEEGERVERHIDEAKSELQSKQGMPGIADSDDDAGEPAEAALEDEEPNAGTVD